MFLLVTRPPGRRQDGQLSKRVVCLCLTKSHIKVEIQNMNSSISDSNPRQLLAYNY